MLVAARCFAKERAAIDQLARRVDLLVEHPQLVLQCRDVRLDVLGCSAPKTASMMTVITSGSSASPANARSTASSTRVTGSTSPLVQMLGPRLWYQATATTMTTNDDDQDDQDQPPPTEAPDSLLTYLHRIVDALANIPRRKSQLAPLVLPENVDNERMPSVDAKRVLRNAKPIERFVMLRCHPQVSAPRL